MKRFHIILTISILIVCLSATLSFGRRQRTPIDGDMSIEILFEPPSRPYKQLDIETIGSRLHNQAILLSECIKLLQKKALASEGDAIILVRTDHVNLDGTRHYATGIIIKYLDMENQPFSVPVEGEK